MATNTTSQATALTTSQVDSLKADQVAAVTEAPEKTYYVLTGSPLSSVFVQGDATPLYADFNGVIVYKTKEEPLRDPNLRHWSNLYYEIASSYEQLTQLTDAHRERYALSLESIKQDAFESSQLKKLGEKD